MSRSESSTTAPSTPCVGCRGRARPSAPLRRPRRLLHRGRRRPRPAAGPTGCAAGPTGWPRCCPPRTDDFGYANLAIRGRKLDAVIAEQVEPGDGAGAGPGHHLRRRQRHPPTPGRHRRARRAYDAALGGSPAPARGCWCSPAFDPGAAAIYRPLRGRFAVYNELVREVADDHGATIVDFWRMREYRDRLGVGHRPDAHGRRSATSTWRWRCSTPSGSSTPASRRTCPQLPVTCRRRETWGANADWAREFLVPWVHRRLTGRSSGDTVSPRASGPLGRQVASAPAVVGRHCGCSSVGRSATFPRSMSRVRVSSSAPLLPGESRHPLPFAPGGGRRARRSARRRCRELESRHPLHFLSEVRERARPWSAS